MGIEIALEVIKQKDRGHTFLQDDAVKLCELATQNPCHLATQLLLLEYAQGYWRFFPQNWSVYYQAASERGLECWKPQELAEIHLLAAQLYYHDQNIVLQKEAATKAFELNPYDWQIIIRYLGLFYETLSPNTRIELIERISKSNPEHPRAYYVQGHYFEDFASESGQNQYREAAINAYQKYLEMGVNS